MSGRPVGPRRPKSRSERTLEGVSRDGGCSAKLAGGELERVVHGAFQHATGKEPPEYLVDNPVDAALVTVGGMRLLISTDTIPPPVSDFEVAGRIAALHAMSDIFACGGTPEHALLSLCVEPRHKEVELEMAMRGIIKACEEEGTTIRGGHTIVGLQTTLGMTIVGRPPEAVIQKRGAQVGDQLMLSKPLGIGLLIRAFRLGLVDQQGHEDAVRQMCSSNRAASLAATSVAVSAATDVTGFGLLGHLGEMLSPKQGVELDFDSVPLLPRARESASRLMDTYWTKSNEDYVASRCPVHSKRAPEDLRILFDPQTNGGLLVAAPQSVVPLLTPHGYHRIGEVTADGAISVS